MEFIDLKAQFRAYQEELEAAALRVLRSGRYILGPEVEALERELSSFVGVKYAVGVSSGTDALFLILKALGVGPGEAVLTSPFTFAATAEVIALLGAKVIFADIDPETFLLSPATVRKALEEARKQGESPRAVIFVSLFGLAAYLDELEEMARKEGFFLIEDACQSLGARFKGRASGAFGLAGATSFFPAKPLGGYGDGGMVFTSEPELAEKIRALRVHGQKGRYHHAYLGLNARLDPLQAALLRVKLKHFPEEIEKRAKVAERYREGLAGLPVRFQEIPPGASSVYAQFVIRAKERDALREFLAQKGIPTAIYYPRPLHLQPAFKDLPYEEGALPVAERLSREVLALPMHPFLTEKDQDFVIESVREFYGA